MPAVAQPAAPQEQIDVTGIRMALLEIAQAQRTYVTAHGAYGTLEQLRAEERPRWVSIDAVTRFIWTSDGSRSFKATATPTDPQKQGWPTLTIDASMQVAER